MPNVELAKRILQAIEANPEQHEQDYWYNETDCGTTMCVAGWACFLSGDKVSYMYVNGGDVSVWDRAENLLSIDYNEAAQLFNSPNESAKRMLRNMAAGDPDWAEL